MPRLPIPSPRLLTSLALASGLLVSSAAAQAPILVQPPTQNFALLSHVGVEATAENFVVTNPAGVQVDHFVVYGAWGPSGAAATDTFTVIFHDNAAGPFGDMPGAATNTFAGLAPAITTTGKMMPTSSGFLPELRLDFILASPVAIPAGTSWLELYSDGNSLSGDQFSWGMAVVDPVGGAPCVSWSFTTPGASWNSCTPFPATDMALEIYEAIQPGPQLAVTNLVSGATATITVSSATPLDFALVGYSVTGAGPTPTIFGNVLLSPPVFILPLLPTDAAGNASLNAGVPPGLTGLPIWFQGYDIFSGALTAGVATTIQ